MDLFAKLEYVNPVGSIKDRAAYWLIFRPQFVPVISNLLLIEAEARPLGRRRAPGVAVLVE